MGKKTGKKRKHSEASTPDFPTPPPPPPPQIPVKYEDMPSNHKKKFFIHDDCSGSLQKYIEIISWLRTMGCYYGDVFEGIGNLNWSEGQGYPLVEIEIETPQQKSSKFLISKNNLYLIAALALNGWFQFSNSGFLIDVAIMLESYNGSYSTSPWERVGPKPMIDAVNLLASIDIDVNGDLSSVVRSCEVFFFHLSEAARLYAVESFVCRSLTPPQVCTCNPRTYVDEERFLLQNPGGGHIQPNDDVYSVVKSDGPVNFDLILPTPPFIETILKKWKNLSKYWFVYALSDKSCLPMIPADVTKFHMRSIKSLRCTLGVLCNTDLGKVLDEWRTKSRTHQFITPAVYKKMETRVRELHAERRVYCARST